MQLVKYENTVLTQVKEVTGLLRAEYRHEINKTTGYLQYEGPLFPILMWQQVLSFFAWTYQTTASESQVRLFVNLKDRTWAAWAFPQEARTGMSARELETPEVDTQRQMFKDSDGWLYFGTVHHHCNASAFQSGTDETNEKNQHGIHITVGGMDKTHHDLHVRFYLKDSRYEVDMSEFWDIGESLRMITPEEVHDRIARHQMGIPSTAAFPQQWRDNLIEPPKTVTVYSGNLGFQSGSGNGGASGNHTSREYLHLWKRKPMALAQLRQWISHGTLKLDDVYMNIRLMASSPECRLIASILKQHDLTPSDLCDELEQDLEMEAVKELQQGGGWDAHHQS